MVYGAVKSTIGNTDHLRTWVLRISVSPDLLQVGVAPGFEVEEEKVHEQYRKVRRTVTQKRKTRIGESQRSDMTTSGQKTAPSGRRGGGKDALNSPTLGPRRGCPATGYGLEEVAGVFILGRNCTTFPAFIILALNLRPGFCLGCDSTIEPLTLLDDPDVVQSCAHSFGPRRVVGVERNRRLDVAAGVELLGVLNRLPVLVDDPRLAGRRRRRSRGGRRVLR